MLQQITSNDRTYPVNFGIRTIATTADALGMSIDKLAREFTMPDLDLSELVDMVTRVSAVAMTEGARKSGTPHVYTQDDVVDLIDDDPALLSRFIELFRASLGDGSAVFTKAAPTKRAGMVAARKPQAKKSPTGGSMP